jgi:hypothetical protein
MGRKRECEALDYFHFKTSNRIYPVYPFIRRPRFQDSNRCVCVTAWSKQPQQMLEFDVLTVVILKSTIIWDVTPSSLIDIHRRFGEIV